MKLLKFSCHPSGNFMPKTWAPGIRARLQAYKYKYVEFIIKKYTYNFNYKILNHFSKKIINATFHFLCIIYIYYIRFYKNFHLK